MKAKEYLNQIRKGKKCIAQKKAEKLSIKNLSEDISGTDYMERMKKIEHSVDDEITTFVEIRHKIINEIMELSNEKYVDILYKHYVEMKPLIEIALDYNYSYNYIKTLHGSALNAFNESILMRDNKK